MLHGGLKIHTHVSHVRVHYYVMSVAKVSKRGVTMCKTRIYIFNFPEDKLMLTNPVRWLQRVKA